MKLTKLLFTIVIASFAFISCNKSSDTLTNAIPANAVYVVSVDTKSLAEKSNYDIFKNIIVSRGLNAAKAYLNKQEAINMLDALPKDINSMGLNIKGDSYFYTDYQTYGLVIGVNDAKKIKEALINFSIATEEDIKFENNIYSLQSNSQVAICWDNDKLLLLSRLNLYGRYSDSDVNLSEMAMKQIAQGEKESINSNPSFAKFLSDKKDISAFYTYTNFDFIEKMAGVEMPEEIKKEINELKGVSSIAHVSFEKGEVKVTSQIYYSTPETEKKYKELTAQLTGELKGDQLKYLIENPIVFASFNIKGAGIFSYLEKLGLASKLTSEFESEDVDVKSIFNSFEGDVTMALNSVNTVKKSYTYSDGEVYEYDSTEPLFAIFADTKSDNNILDVITKKLPEDYLKKEGDNAYSIDKDGVAYHLGIINNMLYFTNDAQVVANLKATGLKNNYASLTKNNIAIVAGNLEHVKEIVKRELSDEKIQPLVLEGLGQLGNYELKCSKDFTSEGKLEFTDKSKNSFAVICEFFDKVLVTFNDQLRF